MATGEGDAQVVAEEEIEVEIDLEDEGSGDDKAKAGAEGGDERAKDQNAEGASDETPEQRRERIKKSGREKRARRREMATRDAELIASLTETVQRQGEELKKVTGLVTTMTVTETVRQRDYWVARAQRAKAQRVKAINEGDAEAQVAAEDAYSKAVRNAEHFHAQLPQEGEDERRQPQGGEDERETRQPQPKADAQQTVNNNRATFLSRHSWVGKAGHEGDTALVQRLDKEVFAAGFRPDTKDYWLELEKRMDAEGLIVDDDDDDAPQAQQREPSRDTAGRFAKAEGGPPVGGRADGAKKGTVKIPKALQDAMIESGAWDDPERRKKIIKDYQARIKANN